jgi:hypothetical protein
VDCWPLFTKTLDPDGNSRLQVFSLLEPLLSSSASIERNYSQLWSVWRSEHNPSSGASNKSLLWNLFRRQVSRDGSASTSFLFGMFHHKSSPSGSSLRLFFIPVRNSGDVRTGGVDSSLGMPQPDAAAHH